jgi:hypothetical protein
MKTYAELLKERIKIRTTDPARGVALTMILDGAAKMAKERQSEVTQNDLLMSARAQIASTEKALEEIKAKAPGAPLDGFIESIKIYQDFIGPQLSEEDIKGRITSYLESIPEDTRTKRNTKNISTILQSQWETEGITNQVDMKIVNRMLASVLK